MARRWSGFLPQNLEAKEEWELLESVRVMTVVQDKWAGRADRFRVDAEGPPKKDARPIRTAKGR
jgi:hypothetical protein